MEINVVDTQDPWLAKPLVQLRAWGKTVLEISPGPNGVDRMVTEIIRKAGRTGTISVLRIYAHGNEGVINITGGLVNAEDELSAISLGNLSRLNATLRRLAPYFAPRSRVELQGCMIARNSTGERLLIQLAQLLQTRVQASTQALSIAAVQFPGIVVEANPQGGLASMPRTELTKEAAAPR